MASVCSATTLLLLGLALLCPTALALSSPLCEKGGQVWVTEDPSRNPLYPGADLYLFCDAGLNVLGDSVDPCLNQGSLCTQAATDAICKFIGYDLAGGPSTSVRARPGEVVRSLSGEYCLREGHYSRDLPDDLASMPGQPCMRVDAITCVRTLQRMTDSLQSVIMEAVMAPRSPAPAISPAPGFAAEGPKNGVGGRRMLMR